MELKPLKIGDLTARFPIIQGGMGVGVSLANLAGAVAACGGIGVISSAQIGFREPDFAKNPIEVNLRAIQKEIEKARQLAKGGIIGINIMVATKNYADYVKAAVKAKVDLIICGAGLPIELPDLVKGSFTKIAPIVSTVKSANVILRMWDRKYHRMPDLLVIEGPKAGGHLGFSREQLKEFTPKAYDEEIKGIITLVRQYEEKNDCRIPVAVAGGIYNKADMEHALAIGADAVQIGTRFVTTYECDAPMSYKERYLQCEKKDIKITNSPVGMPGRAINNTFLEAEKEPGIKGRCYQCIQTCDPAKTPYCITRALVNAVTDKTDDALLFCGANAWKSDKIEHVADIFKEFTSVQM